ncbi:MAG: hypothetical protein Q9187_002737 [Circinaria calcarea]
MLPSSSLTTSTLPIQTCSQASDPEHSEVQSKGLIITPALSGGNFQAVNIAQKTHGYKNGSLDFTTELLQAVDFVDASFGKVVAALKAKKIYDVTLVIIASKHGQAPIDLSLFRKINSKPAPAATEANVSSVTTDGIALIFLSQFTVAAAVDNLNRDRNTLQIQDIISRERLTYLGYGNPKTNPAVPEIIVCPELGIIYTTSKSKIAGNMEG